MTDCEKHAKFTSMRDYHRLSRATKVTRRTINLFDYPTFFLRSSGHWLLGRSMCAIYADIDLRYADHKALANVSARFCNGNRIHLHCESRYSKLQQFRSKCSFGEIIYVASSVVILYTVLNNNYDD